MPYGKIIHLNGPSSAGKTSLARALQIALPELYLHMGTDHFLPMFPHGDSRFDGFHWIHTSDGTLENIVAGADAIQLLQGMCHAVSAVIEIGNNVIVETGFWDNDLAACVAEWERFAPLRISVSCPVDILEKREKERGNRHIGLARMQYQRIEASPSLGYVLDTSVLSPTECAEIVVAQAYTNT